MVIGLPLELIQILKVVTQVGLSIPFDPNWSGRIDHQKVHVDKILGDLSGIKAHQVKLKYNVSGLKIGMIISVISLIILSGYDIAKRKLNENNKNKKDGKKSMN